MMFLNAWRYHKWIMLPALILLLCCGGCASTNYLLGSETLDYKSRAETRSNGAVAVSASALSVDEGTDIYGVTLARKNIQAVWIEAVSYTHLTLPTITE